jgi:hypothetical protein
MSELAPATVRAQPPAAGRTGRRLPTADSLWWLALVAALFTAAQLAFVVPRLGLSWDETVYISQLSAHAPAAFFDPARARGVPLLVAPVTALTGSVIVLRVYLAIASGIGLFLALLTWRGLRPAWMLALAAGAYGSLWVAIYYGPQAMPDEWVAFASLAAVGFFLRAAGTGDRDAASGTLAWRWLAGLAGCVAIAALVRPGDAIFLAGALALAILVRGWRRWQLLVAVAAGLAAGCAEWVVEAYLRFGGPLHRLHLAGAEQGGFGLHAGFWDEFKAANGPTLCRPCTVGVRYPEISLWWLVLPLVALLGILVARRAGRLRSVLLPVFCALAVAFQYLFLINYAAPRFLLPAYALLTIPIADALAWLLTGVRKDLLPMTQVAVFLAVVAQILIQQVVLNHQVAEKAVYFGDYQRIATDLHRLGVRPPSCLVKGSQYIPVAWYAGCASAGAVPSSSSHSESVVFLRYKGEALPGYARGWQPYTLPGIRSASLRFTAYLPPGQPR